MAGVRITCEALWPERLAEQQKGKGRRVDGVERVNDGGILRTDARLAECLEPLCDGRGDDGQVAELRPVLGERRGGFGRLSEGEDSPSHEYIYMYMYINICIYTYIYIHTHTHIHIHIYIYTYISIYLYIFTHMYINMYKCITICVYTYIHVYMHENLSMYLGMPC